MSGLVNVDFKGIGEVLGSVGGLAKDIRGAITGEISPEKKSELEAKLLELDTTVALGQMEINKEEAKHKSLFVSGWRPAAGWVCVSGIAYKFILNPLIEWVVLLCNIDVIAPKISTGELIALLAPLLGIGAYRSYEKVKGVNGRH